MDIKAILALLFCAQRNRVNSVRTIQVLLLLRLHGSMTPTALSRETHCTTAAITSISGVLRKAGLADHVESLDGRLRKLKLTQKGDNLVEKMLLRGGVDT